MHIGQRILSTLGPYPSTFFQVFSDSCADGGFYITTAMELQTALFYTRPLVL